MDRFGSNLAAFVTGTCVGIFMGILYAPEKGSNTRDKLSYQLDSYKNTLRKIIQDLATGSMHFENKAKKEGEKVIKSATEKAEKLLGDVDALIHKIQKD